MVETKTELKPIPTTKRRVAIIAGYQGMDFFGSQKNANVRTVEGEIEKVLGQ